MTRVRAFAVLVAVLCVLHVFGPRGGPEPIVLGILPFDLVIALAWMTAAGLAVVWMTSPSLWPDREDDR